MKQNSHFEIELNRKKYYLKILTNRWSCLVNEDTLWTEDKSNKLPRFHFYKKELKNGMTIQELRAEFAIMKKKIEENCPKIE